MNYFYHVGGSVPIHSPSYIKREADDVLYNTLRNGQLCYVLNSRQMGKSSLWVQTQNRLKKERIQCATIDLSGFGSNLSEDNWYRIIFSELVKAFELSPDARTETDTLWDRWSDTSPIYTLTQFIEDILLKEIEESIIICFDEIDSLLSLNFSSDPFFSFIRKCHEKRNTQEIYKRLTFCLLGVATTTDFIQNTAQSPFNIGRDINLEGFSKGEALKLADGLKNKVKDSARVLEFILEWTGGQPFLTQKICQLIYDSRTDFQAQSFPHRIDVDDFIWSQIVNNWESKDSPQHLRTIRDRLLTNSSQTTKKLLELYREILAQGGIKYDGSPEQIKLRLTGLVVETEGILRVYNNIYRNVFDEQWIEKELNKRPSYEDTQQPPLMNESLESTENQTISEETKPQNRTKKISGIMALTFTIGGVVFILSKIINNSDLNTGSLEGIEIREICFKHNDTISLQSKIESLRKLEKQLDNGFPLECQVQLEKAEIEKMNQ